MPLTRDTWPDAARIRQTLMAQFTLPALPPALHDWLAWCAAIPPGHALYLGQGDAQAGGAFDDDDADAGGLGVLDGVLTVDVPSLYHALNGYRFVLDHQRSTPDALVWHDMAAPGPEGPRDGAWQPHWLVLQGAGGDPLIADVRTPEVPVYTAMHGAGRWDAGLLCDSVAELMQAIQVYAPQRPGDGPPAAFHTVRIVGLGAQPMRVLIALKDLDPWRGWPSARLLQLGRELPITLVQDTVSDSLKDSLVRRFSALGADVRVSTATRPMDA